MVATAGTGRRLAYLYSMENKSFALVLVIALIGIFTFAMMSGAIAAPFGLGKQVADVVVTQSGTWNGYSNLPFVSASVSLSTPQTNVQNYHNVFYDIISTSSGNVQLSTADTTSGKIEYTLVANGESVASGSVKFTYTANWQVEFTIQNVPPGTYTLTITAYEYWYSGLGGILGSGWAERASTSTSVVVNPSSS